METTRVNLSGGRDGYSCAVQFERKTAVVTGASGALGGAAVRAMAYAGANVAACYNSGRERLDTLISEIGDVGVEIKPYKVNSFSQDGSGNTPKT